MEVTAFFCIHNMLKIKNFEGIFFFLKVLKSGNVQLVSHRKAK